MLIFELLMWDLIENEQKYYNEPRTEATHLKRLMTNLLMMLSVCRACVCMVNM